MADKARGTNGTGADAARLYAEREQRVSDAVALRKPDRVPVWNGVQRQGHGRLREGIRELVRKGS